MIDSANLKAPFILPGEFEPAGIALRASLLAPVATNPNPVVKSSTTVFVKHHWANPADSDFARLVKRWKLYKAIITLRAQLIHSGIYDILKAIYGLTNEEDSDGYIFKPTSHAIDNAETSIMDLYRTTGHDFCAPLPRPRVFSDSTGGIIIQWGHNGRIVNAGFPPSEGRPSYLYYESGDDYELVDLTLSVLRERLEWLIHE